MRAGGLRSVTGADFLRDASKWCSGALCSEARDSKSVGWHVQGVHVKFLNVGEGKHPAVAEAEEAAKQKQLPPAGQSKL